MELAAYRDRRTQGLTLLRQTRKALLDARLAGRCTWKLARILLDTQDELYFLRLEWEGR